MRYWNSKITSSLFPKEEVTMLERTEHKTALWHRITTKPTMGLCVQRRLRFSWALNGQLRTQCFLKRTAKTLIRLGECPGWSESSLDAQAILWGLSCAGSYIWRTKLEPHPKNSQQWNKYTMQRIFSIFLFCNIFHHPSVILSKFKLKRREQYLKDKIVRKKRSHSSNLYSG